MAIPGQSALTNILEVKELKLTYQPLLLVEIQFTDGEVLRLSTENLDSNQNGVQYAGHDWHPRILSPSVGTVQELTDNGIVQAPQVTLQLADADKELWTQYEVLKGFKGAKMTVKFVFADLESGTFSEDFLVKFVGVCNAPSEANEEGMSVTASNILNLSNINTPFVPISRRCPWVFPANKAQRVSAAVDEDSDQYHCGYSPDVTDGDAAGGTAAARGNLDPLTGLPFKSCDYTWESCIARLGDVALPNSDYVGPVQIEQDQNGRHTGRFGGIRFDPPSSWRGRAFLSGQTEEAINNPNDAKFRDFFPMIYGTTFVEPPVMNVVGEANSTRLEVAICPGLLHDGSATAGPIQMVLVNDFVVPHQSVSTDVLMAWGWVSYGGRDGHCNKNAIYAGKGDPYGGIACIQISVPRKVSDSSAIPKVRILTNGPKVRVWNSDDITDFDREFTNNNAWCLADLLTWCNVPATKLDLNTFLAAAEVCDVDTVYTDLAGRETTHKRYQTGLALRERSSAADVINKFLAGFKAVLSVSTNTDDTSGQLQLHIRQTLADQQPEPIPGSNDDEAVISADGSTEEEEDGFVAYTFDETNILRESDSRDSKSTFRIQQRPYSDTPNRVSIQFQDQDYFYTSDSLTVVDSRDIGRSGQEVSGGISALGVVNFDQGKRALQTLLAEQYRGNPRSGIDVDFDGFVDNDSGGTWFVEFETTFKAVHLKVSQIVSVSYAKYGLEDQLFRITAISVNDDCSRIKLRLHWHEDDWYLDSYGQAPDPLLQAARRHRLLRPPFGWCPNTEAPLGGDPMFDPTERTFGIAQVYETAADSSSIAKIRIKGKLPVNTYSSLISPPYAPQGSYDIAGGYDDWRAIVAGEYWLAMAGVDADGLFTPPSHPIAKVVAESDGGVLNLPNVYWQENTAGWRLYAGRNPNKMSLQASGEGVPLDVSFQQYLFANEAPPDVMFNFFRFKAKKIWHPGVFNLTISAVSGNTLTFTGQTFVDDEWENYAASILGSYNSDAYLPQWNFIVLSNTGDTITTGIDGVVPSEGDTLESLGVKAGDMFVMRSHARVVTDTTISDPKIVNSIPNYGTSVGIAGATNESPVVIETAAPHPYESGDTLLISGVVGNSGANGQFQITVIDSTHFSLDTSEGTGDYTRSGRATKVVYGLVPDAEIGKLVMVISSVGRGQIRKVIGNTEDTYTLAGDAWLVEPQATSIFIVVEDAWLVSQDTTPVINNDPTLDVITEIGIDNLLDQFLWVQAFTCSNEGKESVDNDSPAREIFAFGSIGSNITVYEKATWNLSVLRPLAVGIDQAPHFIVKQAGHPFSVTAKAKVAPEGGDIHIDIIYIDPFDLTYGTIFGDGVTHGWPINDPGPVHLVIPEGSTEIVFQNEIWPGFYFNVDGELYVNVYQVGGNNTTKQEITVVCKWSID